MVRGRAGGRGQDGGRYDRCEKISRRTGVTGRREVEVEVERDSELGERTVGFRGRPIRIPSDVFLPAARVPVVIQTDDTNCSCLIMVAASHTR